MWRHHRNVNQIELPEIVNSMDLQTSTVCQVNANLFDRRNSCHTNIMYYVNIRFLFGFRLSVAPVVRLYATDLFSKPELELNLSRFQISFLNRLRRIRRKFCVDIG